MPTEAEWNYAAAAPNSASIPGAAPEPTPEHALHSCRNGAGCFWPVGSHAAGDSRYGQADLAGNRWEWTLDSTDDNEINWPACASGEECTGYTMDECNDCADIGEEYTPRQARRQ